MTIVKIRMIVWSKSKMDWFLSESLSVPSACSKHMGTSLMSILVLNIFSSKSEESLLIEESEFR